MSTSHALTPCDSLDVDVDRVLKDPTAAFSDVLHVVPGWDEECAQHVKVQQISGAMSNLVFRCHGASALENKVVIVRVFGRGGKLFSHQHERNIFFRASELGLGPKCLVEFPSARVEEFLPGANLTAVSMREPATAAAIARAMAAFHVEMLAAAAPAAPSTPVPRPRQGLPEDLNQQAQHAKYAQQQQESGALGPGAGAAIWGRIRKWHAVAVDLAAPEVEELGLMNALQELAKLEACFSSRFPSWLGFCHNDLQYGNMLLDDPAAEAHQAQQGPAVRLIDYEYSTLNDVAFDVANHWVEYTYDYHSDAPHAINWDRFPTPDQQLAFCEAYVAALRQLLSEPGEGQQAQQQHAQQGHVWPASGSGGNKSSNAAADGKEGPSLAAKGEALGQEDSAYCNGSSPERLGAGVAGSSSSTSSSSSRGGTKACPAGVALAEAIVGTEDAVQLLVEKALAYATLCHLKWTLWGLIQAKVSDVDFDYVEYSRQRVERYHKAKAAFL
ncbi:hypothetical protein N2152v2_010372 [Parachlorella kessleri]